MIRHVVVFRFNDNLSSQERTALLAELADLPRRFPEMRNFAIGENKSDRDRRFTHGFSAEFSDLATLSAYLTSDEHEEFAAQRFRPSIAERAIVSFDTRPA